MINLQQAEIKDNESEKRNQQLNQFCGNSIAVTQNNTQ